MKMSGVRCATEATIGQLDDPVLLCPDRISECINDRNGGHGERVRDLQDLSDQSDGGV